ncbi:MAG TPA: transporter substrate-binding domain-containing protein [Alloiococcus sp.]|nr:transporter substrate-binding domain-containing protein [Alloiococcus sp.]
MKNNWKKLLSFTSLLAVVLMILIACGENDEGSKEAENENGGSQTVKVATVGTGPPYSMVDEEGNWTGSEADIWAEIEERTGWDIEVQRIGSSATFGQLDTGRSDVAANNYALTEERAEKYIHTIPIYADANTIAVQSDNDEIQTLDDLAGKTVGVQAGQAADIPLTEMSDDIGFELTRYESTSDTFQQLEIARVDAVGGPRSLLNEYIETRGADFRILEENLTATPVVYFLPDTEEHTKLRDELNVVIEEMLADGTIAEITEKWLFTDMTKNLEDVDQ